jgi:hypothetical protein
MMVKMDKKKNWTKIIKIYWTKRLIIFLKNGSIVCKKNGLILGPIPKISQKNNLKKKKPVTGPGTNWNRPVTGTRFPVPVSQNQEPRVLGPWFWPKTKKSDRVDTPNKKHPFTALFQNLMIEC